MSNKTYPTPWLIVTLCMLCQYCTWYTQLSHTHSYCLEISSVRLIYMLVLWLSLQTCPLVYTVHSSSISFVCKHLPLNLFCRRIVCWLQLFYTHLSTLTLILRLHHFFSTAYTHVSRLHFLVFSYFYAQSVRAEKSTPLFPPPFHKLSPVPA